MTSITDWFVCADCDGTARKIPHEDGVDIIFDHTNECPEVSNG